VHLLIVNSCTDQQFQLKYMRPSNTSSVVHDRLLELARIYKYTLLSEHLRCRTCFDIRHATNATYCTQGEHWAARIVEQI